MGAIHQAVIGSLGGGAPAWSPADDANLLFAIFPGTSLTNLFQEITGASAETPATAVDHPIGTAECVATGRYLVAATTDARPLLKQDGSSYYAANNHATTGLRVTLDTTAYTNIEVLMAWRQVETNTVSKGIFGHAATTEAGHISSIAVANDPSILSYVRGTSMVSRSHPITIGADMHSVWSFDYEGLTNADSILFSIDGTPIAGTTSAGAAVGGTGGVNDTFEIMRRPGTAGLDMRLYGIAVRHGVADSGLLANYAAWNDARMP